MTLVGVGFPNPFFTRQSPLTFYCNQTIKGVTRRMTLRRGWVSQPVFHTSKSVDISL